MAWPSIQQGFPWLCPQVQSRPSNPRTHPSPPRPPSDTQAPLRRRGRGAGDAETSSRRLRAGLLAAALRARFLRGVPPPPADPEPGVASGEELSSLRKTPGGDGFGPEGVRRSAGE